MKLAMFLGSGVSFPSKLPSVAEVTRSLLEEEWYSETDGCFYRGLNSDKALRDRDWVLHIQFLLKSLKEHADAYLSSRTKAKATYEDLYYLARQIVDEESEQVLNPAVESYVSRVRKDVDDAHMKERHSDTDIKCMDLADMACNFIQCVVWRHVGGQIKPVGLDFIAGLALSGDVSQLDIFTLNHDTLVEQVLAKFKVPYADGFGQKDGDIRYFEPSVYDGEHRVRLFKLHGSTEWYRFDDMSGSGPDYPYGIATNPDTMHCKNDKGEYVWKASGIPLFLSGTQNKMLDYRYGIFRHMQNQFHRRLPAHDSIIMSGYGWGDRGMNDDLLGWLHDSKKRTLFLLHENPEELRDDPRRGLLRSYDDFVTEKRLIPIKNWMCDVKLAEMLTMLKEGTKRN